MPSTSRPKRVYRRDWKLQTRSVRGSVSLPRLHLISSSRPLFECPNCFSCNDRLPLCLWCKSTTIESAAAFWASMPKQRTVSAPMRFTWSYVPMKSRTSGHGRTRSTETISRPHCGTAPSMRSKSSQNSSLVGKSQVLVSSTRTSTTTPEDMISSPSVTVDQMGRLPPVSSDENTSQPEEGKFHTLPLRRKGHILRTTAGMVVNKSRLSALFRKDAVPVLDKIVVPDPEASPVKARRKLKLRTSTNLKHDDPHPTGQMRYTLPQPPSLPTIPDAAVASDAALPTPASGTYTTPTPPSFLSPFWYRPEEFGRLPASPASRPTSVKTAGSNITRPKHAHTRSEPFPMIERKTSNTSDASPNAWKRRMSGFFRHSISVVTGHKAIH